MMSLFFIKVYKRSDKSKQGYWRVENKIKKNNIELYIKLEKDDFKMRNKELNLTQFETLSDEELQKIEGGYLPIPDMPGWRGQSTPWWWSLKQSNFSDAYSSFIMLLTRKRFLWDLDLILKITMIV